MLLVKHHSNWADEFDIDGFAIYTKEAWQEHLDLVKKHIFEDGKKNYENDISSCRKNKYDFGTNETQEYWTFDDYKETFSITPIKEEAAEILCRLFDLNVNSLTSQGNPSKQSYFGLFACLYVSTK